MLHGPLVCTQSISLLRDCNVSLFLCLQVEIDGENLKDVHIKALRDSIGVVSQEPILFGITIRENILLGNPGARQEEIIEAAKAANCHDFIQDLPQVLLYT